MWTIEYATSSIINIIIICNIFAFFSAWETDRVTAVQFHVPAVSDVTAGSSDAWLQ